MQLVFHVIFIIIRAINLIGRFLGPALSDPLGDVCNGQRYWGHGGHSNRNHHGNVSQRSKFLKGNLDAKRERERMVILFEP